MAEVQGTRKRVVTDFTAAPATSNKRSKAAAEVKPKTAIIAKKEKPKPVPVWHIEEFTRLSVEKQSSALLSGPFCIADNITLKQFHAKIKKLEKIGESSSNSGCYRWEFKEGKAWIYELPNKRAHEDAAGVVISEITAALGAHFRDFAFSAAPRCDDNTAHLSLEPDGAVTVRGHRPGAGSAHAADADGNRFNNVVVEVALTESENHVRAKALTWLSLSNAMYGVQQVIVIKIGPTVRVDGHRTMKAWRYARGAGNNPVQTIEFGNHEANHRGATVANLPGMQLQIPVVSVYHPAAVPAGLGANINIDLFHARQVIEEAYG